MNEEGKPKDYMDFLRPNPEAVFRKEEDGAFLFDPHSGNLRYINGTGARIYELCDGGKTREEIVTALKVLYPDADGEAVAADATSFLRELAALGFLRKDEANES
jgi:hypothetical protein